MIPAPARRSPIRHDAPALNVAALPAETRFLLGVVAAGLGGPAPHPDPGMDWAGLLARVRHHRLEPLMGAALEPGMAMPGAARRELLAMRHGAALRTMRLAGELRRLVRCFAGNGVEVLALKGVALSVLLHGDPLRRACRDIDLLVRPGAEGEARALLARCGYGTTSDAVIPCHNAVELRHARHPVSVELHVRLADDERLLPTAALRPFDTAVEVEVAGIPVRTLGPGAALAYAAYHGAHHHWFRLHWLADIAAAARCPRVDWAEVADIARRAGAGRQLAMACRLSDALFGRAPPDLPPLSERDLAGVRRAEAIIPAILAGPPADDVETVRRVGRLRVLRSELALHRRPRAKWAQLLTRLRPTDTDRAATPLPPRLHALHYPLRILRVLRASLPGARAGCR